LKEIFRFSKSERIASLIILVLTAVVILLLAAVRRVRPLPDEEARVFDSLLTTLLQEDSLPPVRENKENCEKDPVPAAPAAKIPPPVRDPNRMTRQEWEELPLPRHVIRTLLNYRKKGGVFRKKEDLKKIYGMTDSLYEAVSPFLVVEPPKREKDSSYVSITHPTKTDKEVWGPEPLEINSADSAALDRLPGISPWLARRIVRYRKLLGGYVRKEQLLEVYDLDSAVYEKIVDKIRVDPAKVTRININRCDQQTLAHHPYLSSQDAGALIFYREHFGKIGDLQVLEKKHILPVRTFQKVAPYLKTGEEK
jgi:DNA uptake protein ComE-like DNA-binding protein